MVAVCGYGEMTASCRDWKNVGEPYVVAVPCDFRVLICENECLKAQRGEVINDFLKDKWKTVCYREGHKGWLRKKFVAVRSYRSFCGWPITSGWLLGERFSRCQIGDWKSSFSNCSDDVTFEDLVDIVHWRWLVQRFHLGSKSLLGWDEYQSWWWKSFYRYAILMMRSYSFSFW
jgi:SRSO17 transposase